MITIAIITKDITEKKLCFKKLAKSVFAYQSLRSSHF